MSSQRGRWPLLVLAVLAVAWMTMPSWTSDTGGVLVDVFTRRSLTPFYTVSTFVAIGLVGVLLGRAHLRILDRDHVSPAGAIGSLAAAIVLSLPACSGAVLDPIYASAGALVGSLATLAYWSTVLLCLVRGFVAPWGVGPGGPREIFALLGRNSLLTFVLHDALLVVDAFARSELGIGKGSTALLVLFASNVVVLVIVVGFVERSRVAQGWVDGLLLGRSRRGSLVYGGAWSLPGAIALAGILAVYTSSALARPDAALVVDDFESEQCPKWWTFGFVPQERVAGDRGHYLRIHGAAPGTYAHGRGVYMDRDVGERDTLKLRVRGDGPGSGRLKIELSEDDNGNWEIEKQPPLYVPEYDDRFIHEVSVDWRGWRTLSIPLSAFRDDNPRKGNDIFDPERDLTSGGLLELQLLVTPSGALGDEVRIAIDDVRFTP